MKISNLQTALFGSNHVHTDSWTCFKRDEYSSLSCTNNFWEKQLAQTKVLMACPLQKLFHTGNGQGHKPQRPKMCVHYQIVIEKARRTPLCPTLSHLPNRILTCTSSHTRVHTHSHTEHKQPTKRKHLLAEALTKCHSNKEIENADDNQLCIVLRPTFTMQ